MAKQNEPRSVEAILSSKVLPKPQLTEDDKAVIVRELEKHSENLRKHEAKKLAKVLKPMVDVSTLEATGNKSLVKAVEVGAASSQVIIFPGQCFLTVAMHPPYFYGHPENEQVTGTIIEGSSAPGVYMSSTTLAIPSTGDLSLGVAVGRFQNDIYPAATPGEFGETRTVSAAIIHVAKFPAPMETPISVTVTADVEAGDPHKPLPSLYLSEGSSSSAAGGLVGVYGEVTLELSGHPRLTSPNINRDQFLLEWRSAFGSESIYRKNFSVSETIYLLPGASQITIAVGAALSAFRGGMADPQSGLAGVDFRAANTQGLWPLGVKGGPIHISAINMTFCHFTYLYTVPAEPWTT